MKSRTAYPAEQYQMAMLYKAKELGTLMLIDDVVYQLYGSALNVVSWRATLDAIATLLRSRGAIILTKSDDRWMTVLYSPALADAIEIYRRESWWSRNPWFDPSTEAAFKAGDVYRDQDVLTAHQIKSDPFYADFLPRAGLGWQMVAIIDSDFGSPTGLIVQRAHYEPPYTDTDIDTLKLLSRHMEQSLRIASHLVRETLGQDALLDALDTLDRPVFFLDNLGRPLRANDSAEALMGRYFRLQDNVLTPTLEHRRDDFRSALAAASHLTRQTSTPPTPPMTLSSSEAGPLLTVWIIPVVGASADSLSFALPKARVLIIAQFVSQEKAVDPSLIRSVYNLTFGEAKLAALLAAGINVKDAAKALNITEGTCRVVLNRIFKKLGVHRQAELVARLSRLGQ